MKLLLILLALLSPPEAIDVAAQQWDVLSEHERTVVVQAISKLDYYEPEYIFGDDFEDRYYYDPCGEPGSCVP